MIFLCVCVICYSSTFVYFTCKLFCSNVLMYLYIWYLCTFVYLGVEMGAPAVWRLGRMVSWGVPAIDFDSGGGSASSTTTHPTKTTTPLSPPPPPRLLPHRLFLLFFCLFIDISWRPDLLKHMQFLGIDLEWGHKGGQIVLSKEESHARARCWNVNDSDVHGRDIKKKKKADVL